MTRNSKELEVYHDKAQEYTSSQSWSKCLTSRTSTGDDISPEEEKTVDHSWSGWLCGSLFTKTAASGGGFCGRRNGGSSLTPRDNCSQPFMLPTDANDVILHVELLH